MNDLIQFRRRAEVRRYEKNPRKHTPEQVEKILQLMLTHGWTMPPLIDEAGGLIAGHGRDMAAELAEQRGLTLRMANGTPIPAGTIPVMSAVGWTDAQKRAYVIADNKLTEIAGWDDDLLKAELLALQAADFDIASIGFAEKELVTFLANTNGDDGGGEPPESKYSEQYGVIVLCKDEAEQQATYEALMAEGRNCKVVTT